jgi:glutamate-1-semialdehyde 2,1-aminomutase
MVAICADHPFFSTDDWFIGSTTMSAGIPEAIQNLTVKFKYNDLASVQALFDLYPDKIACLFMEAETTQAPANNFLHEVKRLCHE